MLFGVLFTTLALPDIYPISVPFTLALIGVSTVYFILFLLFHFNKINFFTASTLYVFFFYLHNLNFIIWSDIDTLLLEWILLFPVVAYSLKRYSIISYVNISLLLSANILYHLGQLHSSYTNMDMLAINLEYILISVVLYALQRNKNAQSKALLEQKVFLENIFENSSDGILIIEDGKFIKCNKTLVRMLKCGDSDTLLDMYPDDLSPKYQPDGALSSEKASKMMLLALKEGQHNLEWVYKRANGEEFWAEITINKIEVDGKNLLHVISRDISNRKNTELALYELNQNLEKRIQEAIEETHQREKIIQQQSRLAQMGEMLSMIAHQWRQPISSATIDVELSLLSNEYDLDDVQEREKFLIYLNNKVKDVTEYVHILSMTIDDFRNFFKPNKNAEMTLINAPIEKALKIVQTSLNDKNISIIKDFKTDESLPLFHNEILQVILNILKNSEDNFVDAEIENAQILIETKREADTFSIVLKDNGGGIPTDVIDKIFDPYFSTKDEKNGTGLGLYMSKIMIEDHNNGTLQAYNQDDGVVFEITFSNPQ